MNYYDILEIDKNASISDIKKAYKKMALKWHPDKNNDPNSYEMFHKISEAYQVLINKDYRDNYDNYGESPNDLIKPDVIFKEFFSQFDPQVSEFLCDTYDIFSNGLSNYDKYLETSNNTKANFWEFLSTINTNKIIEKGSDLIKNRILNKINNSNNKKFIETVLSLNFTYELRLNISDLDNVEIGMNEIPVDYEFLRKYAFIKLIITDDLMMTHKYLLDLVYDYHEVTVNNINYEFNIEYKFNNPQIEKINNNDLLLTIPINYKHSIHPFFLNYPLSKNLDIKINVDLEGKSNVIQLDTYGILNNIDYTFGRMFIVFVFNDEIKEFEKPKYNIEYIKSMAITDLLLK